jgi:hypothetical protein
MSSGDAHMYSVVETRGGRLRGHFSDRIYAFKGVRFATVSEVVENPLAEKLALWKSMC